MPLPLKLLLLPVLKIVLLGLLKTVFILIGALFFPAFTLRFILGGAIGIIRPLSSWLQASDHPESDLLQRLDNDLNQLQSQKLNSADSRAVLMNMVKETVLGVRSSIIGLGKSWAISTRRFFSRIKSRLNH